MSLSQTTSLSLLQRVKSRDPSAWRSLTRLYGPLVYRWARQKGLGDADACDVTQEVFQAVANRIESFRREQSGDSFRGWLWTISRNRIADAFRRAAMQPRAVGGSEIHQQLHKIADPLDESSGEDSSLQGVDTVVGEALLMRRALALIQNEFEPKTFRAFWLCAVDGRSAKEVAAELQLGVWAVYQAKSRVLRRLRSELEGLE